MSVNRQNQNLFSFKVKILDNENNYKKLKDIFIRKQDIYIIKLLEKRAQNNKKANLDQSLKRIVSYDNKENSYKSYKTYKSQKINKLLDYKKIRIIKKKLDNSEDKNNYNPQNNKNQFEELITSKIYNSDSSRNNKTMLNANIEKFNNYFFLKNIFENKNKNQNNLKANCNKTFLNINHINQKENNIIPYLTNKKIADLNYTKYNKKSYNNHKLLLKDKFNLEKSVKNKNKNNNNNNNIYTKIFNNMNENSIFHKNNANQEVNSPNDDKTNQFHKVFNLFKKERRINDIIKKINKSNNNKGNLNIYRNTRNKRNINKINHSLNKPNNILSLDTYLNELPYINKGSNMD